MKKHYGADDRDRIAALEALSIMDTAPEFIYDEAVQLAAVICEAPVSLFTLLDGTRQWFKARTGTDVEQTPRDQAFCEYAIRQPELMLVPDTRLDPRFRENPLVVGPPNIRFYAGVPVESPEGFPLGTLCVVDSTPRTLTNQQKAALIVLARQISSQLALRAQTLKLEQVLQEKQQANSEINSSNALFRAFMDNCPLVGFMKDAQGRLIYYNLPFAERFQITRDAWIGKNDFAIWPREFASLYRATDVSILRDGEQQVTEDTSPGPNGTIYWRTYKFPYLSASGEPLLAGMSLDITAEKMAKLALEESNRQLREANQRLQDLATTDALTGVANRRAFDERLRDQLAPAARGGNPLSVLLLDIDDFKLVNDTFGHEAGDAVLQGLATILRNECRSTDVVCRYGGEEFALLLPNTPLEQALVVAERLRGRVEDTTWITGRRVTISGGAAAEPCRTNHGKQTPQPTKPSGHDALGQSLMLELQASGSISRSETRPPPREQESDERMLMRRADLALYRAKVLGKNRMVAYEANFEAAELAS